MATVTKWAGQPLKVAFAESLCMYGRTASSGLSRTARFAAAITALAIVTGCGKDREAKQRCIDDAYNAAEAAAVARLFADGKLGTQKQVEEQLGRNSGARPGSSFFDSSGHLIPYRQLPTLGHKIQFLLWINTNPRVNEVTRPARVRARANADPDC